MTMTISAGCNLDIRVSEVRLVRLHGYLGDLLPTEVGRSLRCRCSPRQAIGNPVTQASLQTQGDSMDLNDFGGWDGR